MYQKLFQITLVLLLVAVSIAMVGLVINAVLSAMSSSPLLARDQDVVFVVASVSMRQIGFMIVAASLVIAGFYLFFRRGRFRR
jgi:hypothetical protein